MNSFSESSNHTQFSVCTKKKEEMIFLSYSKLTKTKPENTPQYLDQDLLSNSMFNCLKSLGLLEISFDKKNFQEYSLEPPQHHYLILALAFFLDCAIGKPVNFKAIVSLNVKGNDTKTSLISNDVFIKFERITPTKIICNNQGVIVCFRSKPHIGSQFKYQYKYYVISS